MAKENDIDQLFYHLFPDLKWSQRSNIAADVSEVENGEFDFEAFIDGLSDNASDLPALKLPDGRILVTDDSHDDHGELREELKRHIAEYLRAADAYERELRGLTRHALQQALIDAKTKDAKRKNRVRQKREGNLPFSSPEAQADVTRWARFAPWTPEQAVALSFGKDPRVVDSKQLLLAPASSQFRMDYQRRLDQLHRAIDAGTIRNPLTLADFHVWTRNANIEVPDGLEENSVSDVILDDKSGRKPAHQAKVDKNILLILAAFVCKQLEINPYTRIKPHITDKQADRIEEALNEIGLNTPKSATIKKHLETAIDCLRKVNYVKIEAELYK